MSFIFVSKVLLSWVEYENILIVICPLLMIKRVGARMSTPKMSNMVEGIDELLIILSFT